MVVVYALCAAAALVSALWFGGPYWASPAASLADFQAQAFANAPAATLGADVVVCYVLANVFVVVEGRRLGLRHLWLYLAANTLVAVAFGLSLFLLARERTARATVAATKAGLTAEIAEIAQRGRRAAE